MVYLLLILSALVAGVINAIAGGGTLLTFPALLSVLSERPANQTSTWALLPGTVASAWGYRSELAGCERWVKWLTLPSLLGGAIGALLLTRLEERYFKAVVPWLVLLAAVLFLLQPRLAHYFRTHQAGPPSGVRLAVIVFAQFLIGIYGGYFGAGIGILMLSSLGFLGLKNIHQMNALKSYLAFCMNGVAAFWFLFNGEVVWTYGLLMAAAGIVGGYTGARLALRVKPVVIRWIVIVIAFSLAAYFFHRQYPILQN